jgi:hypothetical protein
MRLPKIKQKAPLHASGEAATGRALSELLPDGESIYDRTVINLSRFQLRREKIRFIGRIREMLRLHAKCIPELINPAAFSFQRAVEKIS